MKHNTYEKTCFVSGCNCVCRKGEGWIRYIRGAGNRVVCDRHKDYSGEFYHGSESMRKEKIGTEKKSSLAKTTIGIEFEMEGIHEYSEEFLAFRGALERAGFVLEHDGSLRDGMEGPSPKCEGAKSLSALLHSAEVRGEDIVLRGDNCGMHIHAAADDMATYRNWYHTLFIPFCEWVDSHDMSFCKANFGGKFRGYAHKIDRNSRVMEHSNFVNMQHDHTIEWRLPRYTTACQTVILLKFWRKVLWMLNNTDWKPEADFATRKAVAVQASKNIVKIATDTFDDGLIDKLNRMTI